MVGDIGLLRGTDQLPDGQEVTAIWLKNQAARYRQAGLNNESFTGPVMDRALAYLESKNNRADINL